MTPKRRYAVGATGISMLSGPVSVSPVTDPLLLPPGSVVQLHASVSPLLS